MDSNATHHLTLDVDNLNQVTPFYGTDQVMIGNGKPISISNIGNVISLSSSKSLQLNYVFYTPEISEKLISVF